MNKYQEALNELKELVHSELDGTRMLDKHLEDICTLQELVDKTIPPTLEEVKKEWEELGYTWVNIDLHLVRLISEDLDTIIRIDNKTKCYAISDYNNMEYQFITDGEHNLLTKTFRALKWMD